MSCALLCLASTIVCSKGRVLRGRAALHAVSLENTQSFDASGDWAAYSEAESEDRSFLLTQIDETENELVKLQRFLDGAGEHGEVLAGLQLSATPVDKKVDKKASTPVKAATKAPDAKKEEGVVAAAVAPDANKKKGVVVAAVAKKEAATAAVKKEVAKPSAAKEVNAGKLLASLHLPKLQGKAALAPMLAMLKGLYEDSKDRISQQNVREEKSKKWFAEKEGEHKQKLAQVEGKFKNGTLSEEFRTNETRDENRYFNYWARVRERQHRQFHTNLKIQHAMMMKTKKMIDMYEKTLSTKPSDQAQAKKQLSQATGMPEIVFLQNFHRTVKSFCAESLAEVRKERAELKKWYDEGLRW